MFSPGNPRLPVRPIDELKTDTLLPAYHVVKLPTPYINSAVSLTKDSYVVEAAIPLAMMHLGTDRSKTWALDVHRIHDVDASVKEDDKAMARNFWNSNAVDVKLFGELELDADLSRYHWDLSFSSPQPGDKEIRVEPGNRTGRSFKGAVELTVTRRSKASSSDFRQLPDGKRSIYRQPVEIQPGEETELLFAHTAAAEDAEERYQFVLSDARGRPVVLGGTVRKDITPSDDLAAPEPTAAEREQGCMVDSRPSTVPTTHRWVPKREAGCVEHGSVGDHRRRGAHADDADAPGEPAAKSDGHRGERAEQLNYGPPIRGEEA